MAKEIEQLSEEDLMELWLVIGGTPHLLEYGKDELKHVLITGECEMEYEFGGETKSAAIGLQLGYYTMAAIVDKLRERGFQTPIDAPASHHSPSLAEENRRLREALEKSVEVIRYWHNVGGLFAHLNNDEITETWKIYYDQSDEMKPIREAIASVSDGKQKEEE